MAGRNADQAADWNGQSGERWVANQARVDAMMAFFGLAAIEFRDHPNDFQLQAGIECFTLSCHDDRV